MEGKKDLFPFLSVFNIFHSDRFHKMNEPYCFEYRAGNWMFQPVFIHSYKVFSHWQSTCHIKQNNGCRINLLHLLQHVHVLFWFQKPFLFEYISKPCALYYIILGPTVSIESLIFCPTRNQAAQKDGTFLAAVPYPAMYCHCPCYSSFSFIYVHFWPISIRFYMQRLPHTNFSNVMAPFLLSGFYTNQLLQDNAGVQALLLDDSKFTEKPNICSSIDAIALVRSLISEWFFTAIPTRHILLLLVCLSQLQHGPKQQWADCFFLLSSHCFDLLAFTCLTPQDYSPQNTECQIIVVENSVYHLHDTFYIFFEREYGAR